ncbi:MAG: 50S ribosomal protein L20 [Candidatus Azambacteria bacterium]|nr:50S ribosomal protein L20 [Candidatus Azambacteria bacterium]
MPRVKRGTTANKRRQNLRKHTKGYRSGRNSKISRMREATLHAFSYMFAHRRKKKGDFRTLWNVQINAASRENGVPYSALIHKLNTSNIAINRKMLAHIAKEHPTVFSKIVATTR